MNKNQSYPGFVVFIAIAAFNILLNHATAANPPTPPTVQNFSDIPQNIRDEILIKVDDTYSKDIDALRELGAASANMNASDPFLDVCQRHAIKPENLKRVFRSLEKIDSQGKITVTKAKDKFTKSREKRFGKTTENTEKVPKLENWYRFKGAVNVDNAIKELNKIEGVHAERNTIYVPNATPNDPEYPTQYNWPLIQADLAWDLFPDTSLIGKDTIVAILDTGVDYDIEDLQNNIWVNAGEFPSVSTPTGKITLSDLISAGLTDHNNDGTVDFKDLFSSSFEDGIDNDGNGYVDDFIGYAFASSQRHNNPADTSNNGHGTHVAGTAAAVTNNGIGVAGTSWHSKIMALNVFEYVNIGGSDIYFLLASEVADALMYAGDNGADSANMSIRNLTFDFEEMPSKIVEDAVIYATELGTVLVAATGNENLNAFVYPAAYNDVIAVNATDQFDQAWELTNYGIWTNVTAPGVDILSVNGTLSGTSMASPHVAGLAALISSYHNNVTGTSLGEGSDRVATIRQLILSTTDPLPNIGNNVGKELGSGRINANNALSEQPGKLISKITFPRSVIDEVPHQFDILGTAAGPDFHSYSLFYYDYNYLTSEIEKHQIGETQYAPIVEGVLHADWDKIGPPSAIFQLELEVNDINGNKAVSKAGFKSPSSMKINGTVRNGLSNIPLAGAVVTVEKDGNVLETHTSDAQGQFQIDLTIEGDIYITANKENYNLTHYLFNGFFETFPFFIIDISSLPAGAFPAIANMDIFGEPLNSTSPVPDVKINGSDNPVQMTTTDQLAVSIALDPGGIAGEAHDWWIKGSTPFGELWYVAGSGWVPSNTPLRSFAGPLLSLPNLTVLNGSGPWLPGVYSFEFFIDEPDNVPQQTYIDQAQITVISTASCPEPGEEGEEGRGEEDPDGEDPVCN